MKKIFYLIVLGLFVFIPKNVFAYVAFEYDVKNNRYFVENGLGVQKMFSVTSLTHSGGKYYNFSASSYDDFGNASVLMHMSSNFTFQGNYDPSKYTNMIVSIYGTPIYDFQIDSSTCIPYSAIGGVFNPNDNTIEDYLVSTYMCEAPKNSSFWLDIFFKPTLNLSLRMNNRVSLIEKNTDTTDVAGAINKQTEEMMKALDEQNKTQQETNDKIDDLNNNITDSDTSDASTSADEFFSGFESNDFGLSSIITAPLNLIKSITSSTCTPIGFKAPFVDQQVTLPCMNAIYKQHFGTFLTIYQTITFGMVAYWVSVKIFFMVKGFKDPDSDRIEVLDL